MDIKQILHKFIDDLSIDPHSHKLWQSFCDNYRQSGIKYLNEIMEFPRQYNALLQTLQIINQEKNLKKILYAIVDTAIEITHAERGFLLAKEREVARNYTKEDLDEYKISKKVAKLVAKEGEALLTDNAQKDKQLSFFTSVQEYRFRSILCCPLAIQGKNIGVLYLDNCLLEASFTARDLQLVTAFAAQAAIAIENAHLHQNITKRAKKAENTNVELNSQIRIKTEELNFMQQKLEDIKEKCVYQQLCSQNPKMQEIFRYIEKIKSSELSVIIEGKSGTGKELIAKAIHLSSNRSQKRFIADNCAAIPTTIFESELFGHEKGAFTGANQLKKGLFEEAHGGTIFLDEIGELSLDLQKKLLRVLEDKKVRRLGGCTPIKVDVRIVAATNRNLEEMVQAGEFREDLYYRLKGFTIYLPPLCERKEDILLLTNYFLDKIATNTPPKKNQQGSGFYFHGI